MQIDLANQGINDINRAEVQALFKKAVTGDTEALIAFEEVAPFAQEYLSEVYGDIGAHVRQKLIDAFVGHTPVYRRGLEMAAQELLSDLCGSSPTAIDRIISEQVVSCWLETTMVARTVAERVDKGDLTPVQMDFYQRWQSRAQRRLLGAIRTLGQTRKLLGMSVQINIADQLMQT